jgi:hypothetical protein
MANKRKAHVYGNQKSKYKKSMEKLYWNRFES